MRCTIKTGLDKLSLFTLKLHVKYLLKVFAIQDNILPKILDKQLAQAIIQTI